MADNNLIVGGVVPVTAYGAAGNGTNDDWAVIQECLTNAPPGSTIVFPAGNYRISKGLTINRKLGLVAAPGTRIIQTYDTATTGRACITVTAPGTTITGFTITGADTPNKYDTLYPTLPGQTAKHAAISVVGTTAVTIRDITITNRICGVAVTASTQCLTDNIRVTGFGTGTTTNPLNYHSAILILGGTHNQVRSCWATGTGQTVLAGSTTTGLKIVACHGANLADNGIYVSSGNTCQIVAYTVDTVIGSGIKVRGSHHTITGCHLANTFIGITATGTTTPTIDNRWGGQGLTITATQIIGTRRHGIYIEDQSNSGHYLRGVNLTGNTLITTGLDGGPQAPIHATADNVTDTGNLIIDHRGTQPVTIIAPP